MFIALAAAGATVAVALGIIGIPLVDACAPDPRGLGACLHDMAERRFDLTDENQEKAAEVPAEVKSAPAIIADVPAETPPAQVAATAPPPPPATEPPATPPAEPQPSAPTASRQPESPPAAVPAVSQVGQPITPTAGATGNGRPEAVLAATVEPLSSPAAGNLEPSLETIPDPQVSAPVANWTAPVDPSLVASAPVPAVADPESPAVGSPSPAGPIELAATEPSTAAAPVEPPQSPAVPAWIAPLDPSLAKNPQADPLAALLASIEAVPPPPEQKVAAPIVEPPDIDAIEVDGEDSFISGSGPAGAIMRLYSDDRLLGESPVQEGRWLVEAADGDIDPDHKLRIEAIDPATGKRLGETTVTVEFEQEPAPDAAPAAEGDSQPVEKPAPPVLPASPPAPPAQEAPAPAAAEPLASAPSAPLGAEPAGAAVQEPEDAAEPAPAPVVAADSPATAAPAPGPAAAETASPSATSPAAVEPDAADAAVDGAVTPPVATERAPLLDAAATSTTTPALAPNPAASLVKPVEPSADASTATAGPDMPPTESASAESPPVPTETSPGRQRVDTQPPAIVADEPEPTQAPVVNPENSASVDLLPTPASPDALTLPAYQPGKQAPLIELPRPTAPALLAEFHLPAKPSGDAVTVLRLIPFGDPVDGRFTGGKAIIRRGDTLWSIAHRYYGSGIHYRTIFKANRNQISRPSKIFPGQIFDLPLVTEE